jgi:hypothetical protein
MWAEYWIDTIAELRDDVVSSSKRDEVLVDQFLMYSADSN